MNHMHPKGPWKLMNERLGEFVHGNAKVLDLATGPGEPGTLMAKSHPNLEFTLTDLFPDMLEKAKKYSSGLPNVKYALADMEDLSDFPDASFDAVVCCYGLMFPDDKVRALNEINRVLTPQGIFITAYWHTLVGVQTVQKIMETIIEGPAPPPPLNPQSLSEEGLVEGMLHRTNFDIVSIEEQEYPFDLGTDPERAFMKTAIPALEFLENQVKAGKNDAFAIARKIFFKEVEVNGWKKDGKYSIDGNRFKVAVAKKLS